jgi:hypothetical protein
VQGAPSGVHSDSSQTKSTHDCSEQHSVSRQLCPAIAQPELGPPLLLVGGASSLGLPSMMTVAPHAAMPDANSRASARFTRKTYDSCGGSAMRYVNQG